jgi:hypothetical protein
MSDGMRLVKFAGVIILCLGIVTSAVATDSQRKPKKPQKPQLPPLASGPTGQPVPPIPLDLIAPVPPQVSYEGGQLTIVAPNSTLADILRAVRRQTGAEIEIPVATDRVVTHLGPGPARDVVAELLNGSRFNYVLLGSPEDANTLTRVVLVAKSGPDVPSPKNAPPNQPQPVAKEAENTASQPEAAEETNDTPDAQQEATEENTATDQPAEAEQPATPAEQPGVKTPQELLQEMQQRQLQLQQQQQMQGQPPTSGHPQEPQQPEQ